MPNAQTKAASNDGPKKERKKPVRTAPAQKDYPSKLAWLQAMTEHEQRIADELVVGQHLQAQRHAAHQHERDRVQCELLQVQHRL